LATITGLGGLTKHLEEAQRALAGLDRQVGTVNFDPNDPGSIEGAIQQVELMIDARVGAYARNPIISPLIEQTKEQYREGIIQKAAAARLENDHDD
jgi:tetrahydromethanopterin S-methyltransferase subunit A